MSAKDFTQFVRGSLFAIVDLLTTNWPMKKDVAKGEEDAIIALCGAVIKLICKWLSLFPKHYSFYLEAIQHPNLYLVSLPHAIAVSLPELSEMLKLTFGLIKRCENTFAVIAKDIPEKSASTKTPQRIPSGNSLQRLNITTFQSSKGFELVASLIKNSDQQYPVTVLIDLIEPLAGALRVLRDDFSKQYSSDVLKEITDRFSALNDKEVKEMTKPALDKLFYMLESLKLAKDPTAAGREAVLVIIFSIAVQLIKSSYIQKKLLGLSIIKEMIPKRDRMISGAPLGNMEWKEPRMLTKAMEEHKLLDIILGENAHAEILRKVEDIFVFLLTNDKLDAKHIDLLWKCSNEKHEDIMRTCLSLLSNIVCKMGYPLIQELFKHIEATSCESEILIKFLETYTLNVLQVCKERDVKSYSGLGKKKAESTGYKLYNLDIFWNLLLDSSQVPGKLKDQAMEALIGILNKHSIMANDYVMKATECIKNEQIVIRGIQLLKDIDFAEYYIVRESRREPFYKLVDMNSTYSIIKNTLKDCENYHQRVHKEVAGAIEKQKNVMDIDFGTGFTFSKQAKLYVEFFEYYCSKGNLTLAKEDFLKLWKCYIEESFCSAHADILFSSMTKETSPSTLDGRFILLSDKVAKTVFEELLCGTGVSKLTLCGFACFKTYMNWINQREPVLTSKTLKSALELHEGLPTLWGIAFQSDVVAIKEQAKEFLVNLVDKLCTKNKTKRREITEKGLESALNNVKDLGNVQQTQIALNIIDSIIEKIECLKYEEVVPAYSYPPLTTFQFFTTSGVKPTVLQINENMKLSSLMCLLSNEFKIHKSRIVLRSYQSKIEYGDDCDYFLTSFKRLTDNKFWLEFRKNEIPNKDTPRYILANSTIFSRLQELLKSPKEEIVDKVWKLILTLPLNEDYKERLRKLGLSEIDSGDSTKKTMEWERYLEISHGYEPVPLVYYLYVLNELIGDKDTNEKKAYSDKFLKKGGTAFLLSVFAKKKESVRSKLNLKCLEYCIRIISVYILPESYSAVFETGESDIRFWHEILELIEWISVRGSTKKSMNTTDEDECLGELFAACCQSHYALLKASPKFISSATNKTYVNILKECLLRNRTANVKKNTLKLLRILLLEILKSAEHKKLQKELLNILMLDFLKVSLEEWENSESYFELMNELIVRLFMITDNPKSLKIGKN